MQLNKPYYHLRQLLGWIFSMFPQSPVEVKGPRGLAANNDKAASNLNS
jgi:hypothetical protein